MSLNSIVSSTRKDLFTLDTPQIPHFFPATLTFHRNYMDCRAEGPRWKQENL